VPGSRRGRDTTEVAGEIAVPGAWAFEWMAEVADLATNALFEKAAQYDAPKPASPIRRQSGHSYSLAPAKAS